MATDASRDPAGDECDAQCEARETIRVRERGREHVAVAVRPRPSSGLRRYMTSPRTLLLIVAFGVLLRLGLVVAAEHRLDSDEVVIGFTQMGGPPSAHSKRSLPRAARAQNRHASALAHTVHTVAIVESTNMDGMSDSASTGSRPVGGAILARRRARRHCQTLGIGTSR
jgi:hypothetical protein